LKRLALERSVARASAALLAVLAFPSLPSPASEKIDKAEALRARYTKYEHRVPMRDGARLFTAVFVPKDAVVSPFQAGGAPRADEGTRFPVLMTRTPYSCAPYGPDRFPDTIGPSEAAEKETFVFVCQDVRGRFQSEGEFQDVRPLRPGTGPTRRPTCGTRSNGS
jgi:hypothetical protein